MKNLGVMVTIMIALIGGFIGYGQLRANAQNTEKQVEEVKTEIKEQDDKIGDLEDYTIRQSFYMEQFQSNQKEIQSNQREIIDVIKELKK